MPVLELEKPKVFRDVKEAPMLLLLLVLLSDIAFNWLYVNFLSNAFSIPGEYTEGIVDSLLVLNVIKISFVILGVIFWIGGFRSRHLGIENRSFNKGILTTFFMWAMLQIVQVAYGVITSGPLDNLSAWENTGFMHIVGGFVFFAVGKAFFDELTYRGLLLPQVHLKCRRYINLDERIIMGLAIVISQSIYLIIQLPLIGLITSTELSTAVTLTSLFFLSILNSLIFLRTKNLYITIGLHTLWYHPVFIAAHSIPHIFILILLAVGVILIWPLLPNTPPIQSLWPLERRQSS